VSISGNAIWVTSQGPCGEHVHQFEMFAILQYVVKLVIKPIIFNPFARQPVFHSNHLCRTRCWGVVLMSASEYEVDVTTRNGVMAHFT